MFRITLLALFVLAAFGMQGQVYGDPIISFDFADGIPEDWENGSESGIGIWEYRGPDTTPDNTVASLGSCGGNSVVIDSETVDNGFVIFDSNYWDDPIGPCGNLGSGEDPGAHIAWLRTGSIDLSNNEEVVITFRQQWRHNDTTETSLSISTDGGESWEALVLNSEDGFVSAAGEWASVNITDIAGGEPDVRFEFMFEGFYYYWMLDDITLYIPSQNDLLLENGAYDVFDGTLPPNGFGGIEYSGYPSFILDAYPFTFSSDITNVGAMVQDEVSMNVRVTNENDEFIFSENTEALSLNPGETVTVGFQEPWEPSNELGDYTIRFKAEQLQEDQTPLNNEQFKDYEVTEFSYNRDEGPMVDTFIPSGIYAGETYLIGNVFESKLENLQCASIGVGIADPSLAGAEIFAAVYDLGLDGIIAQTDPYTINEWDINTVGEEKVITLPLQSSFLTEADTAYAVMVGINDPSQEFYVSRSGVSPPQTSIIFYPNQNLLFYLVNTPVVRLHLFPQNANPGCIDETAENYDPNADTDDGSCRFYGCTDEEASNYDANANFDDGTCELVGCTDPEASNYDENANIDDGSCLYPGCTDENATNFDPDANDDDGSCTYEEAFLGADIMMGCAPLTVVVTNQTNTVGEGSCLITIEGLLTIEDCVDDFTFEFTEPGTYNVEYSYTVGDFESTFTLGPIEVYEVPDQPVVEYNDVDNVVSCVGCDGAADINWYINGDLVQGQSSESWEPLDNGNYSVEIITAEGCNNISDEQLVVVVNIDENDLTSLLVYPNPTVAQFYIRSEQTLETIQVFDAQGKQIVHLKPTTNQVEISTQDWATGVYTVLAFDGAQRIARTLIKR